MGHSRNTAQGYGDWLQRPPGPTTHDTVTVARILVDIRFAASGQPFSIHVELTRLAPDV
jgi:hypothetical protein